jgi:adenosine 3'-phospho 5'-phosphosulfate transporter B3
MLGHYDTGGGVVNVATMHNTGLAVSPVDGYDHNTAFNSSYKGIDQPVLPHHFDVDDGSGDVYLFFIKMRILPRHVQLVLCAVGAITFYILSGVTQEYIFVHYKEFDYGFFLTLFQFIIYALISSTQRWTSKLDVSLQSSTLKWYALLAALTVAGVGLGNQSLSYVNYPTKILFKSSKLLFAMIAGLCIIKRRYNVMDYIASILLVLGLIVLFGANHNVQESSQIKSSLWGLSLEEVTGVTMLACALMADAVTSNIQEKILKNDNRSPTELIFFGYSMGACMLVLVCIVTNQLVPAIQFCVKNPYVIILLIGYSLVSYMGVQFVHTMTKLFGILVTLTVTSSRKVATIILSYILFPKPMTLSHLLAIVLVFCGIFLRIYNKNKDLIDNKIATIFKRYNYDHMKHKPKSSGDV